MGLNLSSAAPEAAFRQSIAARLIGQRLFALAALLAVEWIPIAIGFSDGYFSIPWVPNIIRSGRGLVFLFILYSFLRIWKAPPSGAPRLDTLPFRWDFFWTHIAALLLFIGLSILNLRNVAATIAAWCLAGIPAVVFAILAFLPREFLGRLVRGGGKAWAFAAAAAIAIRLAWMALFELWNDPSGNWFAAATFRSVKLVLGLFLARVEVDSAIRRIGTPGFHVRIDAACSGVEGLSLILVLTAAWLWFFRSEFRFPRALLLIPAALAVMWLSNVLRIAALVLIGSAGYPNIAVKGFHSAAGWIAFTGISLIFLVTAQHSRWLSLTPAAISAAGPARNPTAAYLLPFVTILLSGLVSSAASAGFEWLYPLRLLTCAIALWFFRPEYRRLEWRVSWFSPCVGALVFALWISFDGWMGAGSNQTIGAALAGMPAATRFGWLAARVIAAVLTVPIAEELAFRGYAARRLMSADFESVAFHQLTLFPIAISSLLFGVLHGGHWAAGTLAGAAYAAALRRRGSIGDAVAAHATTNALLAAWVLTTGNWRLW